MVLKIPPQSGHFPTLPNCSKYRTVFQSSWKCSFIVVSFDDMCLCASRDATPTAHKQSSKRSGLPLPGVWLLLCSSHEMKRKGATIEESNLSKKQKQTDNDETSELCRLVFSKKGSQPPGKSGSKHETIPDPTPQRWKALQAFPDWRQVC